MNTNLKFKNINIVKIFIYKKITAKYAVIFLHLLN